MEYGRPKKRKDLDEKRPYDTVDHITSKWTEGGRISYGSWSNTNDDEGPKRKPLRRIE